MAPASCSSRVDRAGDRVSPLDPFVESGHDRAVSGATWKERLAFHEQNTFLRNKGLVLADPRLLQGHTLPQYASAWEAGGRVRTISVIVNRAQAQNPGILARAILVGNLLGCDVTLIVPNCYEALAERASRSAAALLASASPDTEFREPMLDVHPTSKFAVGDTAWIVDTTKDGNARRVEVTSADLRDDPIYTVTDPDDGKAWNELPENAIYTTALAASSEANVFDDTFATGLKEGLNFRDARAKVVKDET